MEWIHYLVAAVFCLLGLLCVGSTILSLPGGWIMVGLAAIIEYCDQFYLSTENPRTFGWTALAICTGLLAVGELIEFVAGAAGAKRGGAGRRGMIGALIGGILGAIFLTPLIPIPIVGTLIGAVLGTFAGAILGEISGQQPRTLGQSIKPAIGATIGRLAGTFGKMLIAVIIWAALSVIAFV